MTEKYLSSSHDKSSMEILNAKERCFSDSFILSFLACGTLDHPLSNDTIFTSLWENVVFFQVL